jgi:hypothetical protein
MVLLFLPPQVSLSLTHSLSLLGMDSLQLFLSIHSFLPSLLNTSLKSRSRPSLLSCILTIVVVGCESHIPYSLLCTQVSSPPLLSNIISSLVSLQLSYSLSTLFLSPHLIMREILQTHCTHHQIIFSINESITSPSHTKQEKQSKTTSNGKCSSCLHQSLMLP